MTTALVIVVLCVLAPLIFGASIKLLSVRPSLDERLRKLKVMRDSYELDDPTRIILDAYINELEEKKIKRLVGR